ncbi:MAG: ferredoxin [Polyangiales bacterium]
MKVRVVINRDLCGAHGMCEREAPEVFRIVETDDYTGAELIEDQPHEDPFQRIRSAVAQCPNLALSIEEL